MSGLKTHLFPVESRWLGDGVGLPTEDGSPGPRGVWLSEPWVPGLREQENAVVLCRCWAVPWSSPTSAASSFCTSSLASFIFTMGPCLWPTRYEGGSCGASLAKPMLPGHIRAAGTLYTNMSCQRQGRGPPEPSRMPFFPPWPCGGLGPLLEHMSGRGC